jgi:hypothetical protein
MLPLPMMIIQTTAVTKIIQTTTKKIIQTITRMMGTHLVVAAVRTLTLKTAQVKVIMLQVLESSLLHSTELSPHSACI